jgi:hypothetical protein
MMVTLLMDTEEYHSKAGGGAIGIKLLELRSDKQLKDLPHEKILQLSNQVEGDWIELKVLSHTRSHDFHPHSYGNVHKKPNQMKEKQNITYCPGQ